MKSFNQNKFAKNLKKLRQEKGLSQKALSKQTGASLHWIRVCENGKAYGGIDELINISAFFGVPIDLLLFGEV